MTKDFSLLDLGDAGDGLALRSHSQTSRDLEVRAGSPIRIERREVFPAEPQTRTATPPAAPIQPLAPPRRGRRRFVFALLGLAATVAGGWYGYHWWTVGRFIVWTDDAYVSAKTATLAAKVPGYIASLDVADNAS